MSAMAPAGLLLAIGLVCVVIAVGMNVVTAAHVSGGKAMSKERRIRSAVLTVFIAVVGLVCMVAWFVQS
jgi:uncharacterized membrane protein